MGNCDQRTDLLRQLHVLNRHCIEWLLALPQHECSLTTQLSALDARAIHELCATPFTLYELPFADDDYWQDPMPSQGVHVAVVADGDRARHLTAMTLFFAWHVVHKDPVNARSFFGMGPGAFDFFRAADVATLVALVEPATATLRVRWPGNPHFWPDLIRFAGKDGLRLQATRILGAQLLAAELLGDRVPALRPRRTATTRSRPRDGGVTSPPDVLPLGPLLIQPI